MFEMRERARTLFGRRQIAIATTAAAVIAAGITGHSILAQQPLPTPAQQTAPPKPITSGTPAGQPPVAPAGQPQAGQGDAATTLSGDRIIVRREALSLIDSRTYRIGFHLNPYRTLDLIAPQDGFIAAVQVKVNDRVEPQHEVTRFDDRVPKLKLDRAKAAKRIAEIKLKQSETNGEAAAIDLARAEIELADADLELAKNEFDAVIIRAPFSGEVHEVYVVPGQFVRAGDRLLTIADTSRLKVEVPWERTADIAANATVPLKIEDKTVDAVIESIKPLDDRFVKLRDLANSVTSLVLVIDNPTRNGRSPHFVGQSVFPPLIPRHTVTEIPTKGVLNDRETGERKVQVLRDLAIRDVAVQILGSVGPDRVFVSGPFEGDDELVLESSVELADGTQLRPFVSATASAESPTSASPTGAPVQPPAKRLTPGF